MCGIAGKFQFADGRPVAATDVATMLDRLAHRGPDGQGIHVDGPVGLGHCRLSIIDLAGGSQPMTNEDGTAWIVFNGEIYNFAALRTELLARGHQFHSRSDTEVILHLYEELGPDCVRRLDGMFTFALWDSRLRRLVLARDRIGIKPLYYAKAGDSLYFASELKAILAAPDVSEELDPASLWRFLAFHYLPGERTLHRAIHKLPPGHYLVADRETCTIRQYWDLEFNNSRHDLPLNAAVAELRTLLEQTVRSHLISDVPVGLLLSGGMDSSAVLSLASRDRHRPLQTFTVGFSDSGVTDERPYARAVAQRFGAEHHEISITAEDFWNFLPRYAWHMEEPVNEPPAIALYYVSRLARGHVKVLLSGEGGDEAFGGYPNYVHQLRLQDVERLLGPLSQSAGVALTRTANWFGLERMRRYGTALGRPLPEHYFSRASTPASFFNRANGGFYVDRGPGGSPAEFMAGVLHPVSHRGRLDQMLYADTKTWLPDDLLVKADKMTMANSLELRVPLLDHHVLEFAASLPPAYKVQGSETKRILKAAFAQVLPSEIIQRPKAGFPVPYGAWLRGPLAGRTREVLLSSRALGRGYFERRGIERLLADHAERGGYAREIFCLLALEFWHRAFVDGDIPSATWSAGAAVN